VKSRACAVVGTTIIGSLAQEAEAALAAGGADASVHGSCGGRRPAAEHPAVRDAAQSVECLPF
jgi:hypothetical protein